MLTVASIVAIAVFSVAAIFICCLVGIYRKQQQKKVYTRLL